MTANEAKIIMQYKIISKNDVEIAEYHRMRFSLWSDHNEKELYN